MPNNKYTDQIRELERTGKFAQDVCPVNPHLVAPMDPDQFRYCTRNPFGLLWSAIARAGVWLLGPVLNWFAFDLRVKGRKHLRQLGKKGAVVVNNHVHILDSLITRQMSRTRRMYYLAAPFNNKKGFGGYTLRVIGVLPLSDSLKLIRQLDNTVTDLLHHRRLLTIAAEESMWPGYTKIRPLKKGAFYYAVKNDSPVVPVVLLFRPTNFFDRLIGRRTKITLQILPPIFPDPTLDRPTNTTNLQAACHAAMVKCASDFYHTDADATHYQETATDEPDANA